MKIHESVTKERVEARHHVSGVGGFCINCGTGVDALQRYATRHECSHCGEHRVFATSELLLSGLWWRAPR